MQNEKHTTAILYPYRGFTPYSKVLTHTGLVTVVSPAAAAGPPNCPQTGSDTAICTQILLDSVGIECRLYREFSDSIGARFVPFLQACSYRARPVPTSCLSDTNWYHGLRPPTENETKCLAGIALANGASGLLWFKMNSLVDSVQIPCGSGSIWFDTLDLRGLNGLPEVQAAMENFISPFVDSLGSYFANFQWIGSGRADAFPYTNDLASVFDSVRSLTFSTPGDSAYIEAGVYTLPGSSSDTYFLLVNRRAYDTVAQSMRVWMPLDTFVNVIDMYTKEVVEVSNCCGQGEFTTSIEPGEFKLFKRVPASPTTASGVLTPAAYQWNRARRIPAGDSLVLGNGVTISLFNEAPYFAAGCDCGGEELIVEGKLKMIGSGSDPYYWPTIKAAGVVVGQPRGFNGIRVLPGGSVEINGANILGAEVGLSIESDAPSSVRYAMIWCDSGVAAIYSECDSLKVRSGTVLYTKYGTGFDGRYARVDLDSVCFDHNDRHIFLQGCSGDIRNCRLGQGAGPCTYAGYPPEWTATYGIYTVGGGASPINVDYCRIRGPFSQSAIRKSSNYGNLYISHSTIEGMGATPYGVYADVSGYVNMRCSDICGTTQSAIYAYKSASDFGNGSGSPGYNDIHNYTGKAATAIVTAIKAEYNWWGTSCANVPGLLQTSTTVDYQPCLSYANNCSPWYGGCSGGGPPPPPPPPPLEKAVENDSTQTDPGLVWLEESYPNPFNAATIVSFYLPEQTEARLTVYNVLGQQVTELASGIQAAGWHNITWNGASVAGHTLASGVYLLRLQAGGATATRKLALVR